MPFKIVDQPVTTESKRLYDDLNCTPERQVGFWKTSAVHGSLSAARIANGEGPTRNSEISLGNGTVSSFTEGSPISSMAPQWPMPSQYPSHSSGNANAWESSLFSSSFSDIFHRKARLSANEFVKQHSPRPVCEDEEPFEASAEIEAKTIGNLLPAEDDLFTGVNFGSTGGDEVEDFDLFSSGGGMELEGEDSAASKGLRNVAPPGFEFEKRSPSLNYGSSAKNHSVENSSMLPSRQIEQGSLQPPIAAFMDPPRIPTVPQNVPFTGRQMGLLEPSLIKNPNHLHPPNGYHFSSPSSLGHIGPKMVGGISSASVRGGGPSGRLMDINEVSGSPRSPAHFLWSKPNHHIPNQVMWPNSPSFVRGANPHHLSHITGFARPPVMLPSSPAHHVGSAPTVNPSMWDRRHVYSADLSDSLGVASSNVFSRVPGSMLEIPKHGNNFPNRSFMLNVPCSFDSSSERGRSFPHRRVDPNPNPCDRKQYDLDVDRILRGEDTRTTLMIKNIPNKYTSKMLLAAIDEHCRGTYDFIYLPIDFKNKCNVGYAFINMVESQMIIPFHNAFNGKKWEKFNSEKVTNLAYARIQGKTALVAHFQNSSLMNEDKRCRPILFRTDGPNAGDPEPFPVGPNIRLKVGKSRPTGNEENSEQILTGGLNMEDSGNGTDDSSISD